MWAAHSVVACTLEDVSFMQGEWRYSSGAARGEERWVLTPAHTLAGSSWEAKDGMVSYVESLAILSQGDRLEMHIRHFDGTLDHAWEDKESPMVFVLARCDAGACRSVDAESRQLTCNASM
jgi:hypothetical protein